MDHILEIKNLIETSFNIKISSINSFGKRTILIGSNVFFDITITDKQLIIETISIPLEKRHKGLTKAFVIKLLEYVRNDKDLEELKISAIISKSLETICKSLDFCHEDFIYPNFNTEDYESFDGFYGSYTKKCS